MINEESGIIQFTDVLTDTEFDELENRQPTGMTLEESQRWIDGATQ